MGKDSISVNLKGNEVFVPNLFTIICPLTGLRPAWPRRSF